MAAKSLKGTKTEQNLLKAFAGESQARNRYTYFAGKATKEGFVKVSEIFTETANQEREHAKRFFKFLEGGDATITATFPAGKIGTTAQNLKAAADGEHEEWGELYPSFAQVARSEGFETIAVVFERISVAEKHHEARFRALLRNIEEGTMFKKPKVVRWRCLNCGYIHEGTEAPEKCPACDHKTAFFEAMVEEW